MKVRLVVDPQQLRLLYSLKERYLTTLQRIESGELLSVSDRRTLLGVHAFLEISARLHSQAGLERLASLFDAMDARRRSTIARANGAKRWEKERKAEHRQHISEAQQQLSEDLRTTRAQMGGLARARSASPEEIRQWGSKGGTVAHHTKNRGEPS